MKTYARENFPLYGTYVCVSNTVKPLNKGQIGDGPFVPCTEVVLFSEVISQTYWKVLKDKNKNLKSLK